MQCQEAASAFGDRSGTGGVAMDQPFRNKIILSEDISRSIERMDCFLHRFGYVLRVGRTGEEILDLM